MRKLSLAILGVLVALPAAAQQRGGIGMNSPMGMNSPVGLNSPGATLGAIEANQGCPLSSTSVTVGLNKASGTASSAQQQLATSGATTSKCRPLVSTQVVAGVNLALGRGSNAGQTVTAQGPRGALATDTYTRGYNLGYGAFSTATQRLSNQVR